MYLLICVRFLLRQRRQHVRELSDSLSVSSKSLRITVPNQTSDRFERARPPILSCDVFSTAVETSSG